MQEIWKDIKNYEGLYQVSNLGNIKKLKTVVITKKGYKQVYKEHIMKPAIRKGYYSIWLTKNKINKVYNIHRLVYESFIENIPKGMVIDHIDGNKLNNTIDNLECITQKENIIRFINNSLHKKYNN